MAFTFDPTTARGRVRLGIGDTDTVVAANQIFTDAEIDAFLALASNNVDLATARAAYSVAASGAASAVRYAAAQLYQIDRTAVPDKFRDVGDSYLKLAETATGAGIAEEIDALAYEVDEFGKDTSEFVGDPT